jgi:hypothetical protein
MISPYGRARLVTFLASLLIAACPFLEAWSTTPVFFSSRTGWQTAVGQHTDVDFEGLAPSRGYTLYPTPPGLTLQGINFGIDHTANNGSLYVIGPDLYYTGNSALSSQQSSPGPQNFLITLPAGTRGVALDFGNLAGSGGSIITFNLSDGQTFTRTTGPYDGPNGPNWFSFVGFTVDDPITSLKITQTTSGSGLEIDNFSISQVPEPPTSMIAVLAVCLFLATRKSLKSRAREIERSDF